jgi:hypothetical protein
MATHVVRSEEEAKAIREALAKSSPPEAAPREEAADLPSKGDQNPARRFLRRRR